MKPRPYRILRAVKFFYALIGWIGLLASFLLCGFMSIISLGQDSAPAAAFLAVVTAVGIGFSLFIGSVLAIAFASTIDLLFEIQERVFFISNLPRPVPIAPSPTPQMAVTATQPISAGAPLQPIVSP